MRKYWTFRKRRKSAPPVQAAIAAGFRPEAVADDQGEARYFHGRNGILRQFAERCHISTQNSSGTTFLVQGAPGAGKTALLAECAKQIEARGWRVVNIRAKALYDPATFMEDMGRSYTTEQVQTKGGGAGPYACGSVETHIAGRSVIALMREVAGHEGLVLVLDEVQNIGDYAVNVDASTREMKSTLDVIHNGQVGRPIMLLAGGLGTSQVAFGKLGISRFMGGCVVQLGSLSTDAERAVLRDWLTKDGQAKGDVTPWIDAITKETHGWPQHILSYVDPALDQLHESRGMMTPAGLKEVLHKGRVLRTAYYEGRTDGIDTEELQALTAALIRATPKNGVYKSLLQNS